MGAPPNEQFNVLLRTLEQGSGNISQETRLISGLKIYFIIVYLYDVFPETAKSLVVAEVLPFLPHVPQY